MVKTNKFSLKYFLFALVFLFSLILSGAATVSSAQAASYLSSIDTSGVYIIASRHSGLAIEPLNNATSNGTLLVQSTIDYADTQKWIISEAGDGYYYITNFSAGNVIDITGAKTTNGANAILYTNKGGTNQQWEIVSTGDGYYSIASRKSGKNLDVNGKSTSENAEIIQYTSNGGTNQQWALINLSSSNSSSGSSTSGMRDISSFDFVADMGYGWNLGNTLDSKADWLDGYGSVSDYEMAWGNPVTTKAMIDTVKAAGFSTVRIPITWDNHLDSNFNIDSAWLDRVQTVVDYVINNDMYAIINLHHEDDWVLPYYSNIDTTKANITTVWTQIANRFKNYDDKLIFETLNEPRNVGGENEWNGGTEESRYAINVYNQTALNAIRATGGNNAVRFVMVPTQAASSCDSAINGFVLPTDSANDRLMVSLHMYTPYDFALNESGTSYWGSSGDMSAMEAEFNKVYNKFCANGTPIVIGEFNALNKDNDSSRATWAEYFASLASAKGMACILWDNGADDMGQLNRNGLYWDHYSMIEAIANGFNNGYSGGSSDNSSSDNSSSQYVTFFWGSASATDWGQAVSVATTRAGGSFDASEITSGGHFYVEYSGTLGQIEFILQSWSGGEGWAKVSPLYQGTADNGNYYAIYSYDDCVTAFGSSNFSGLLDMIHIGASGTYLEVYSATYDKGQ